MAINLGAAVKCSITGFQGVVVAETRWMYGCIRYLVQPVKLEAGKMIDAQQFDEPQLIVIKDVKAKPVDLTGGPIRSPTRPSAPSR